MGKLEGRRIGKKYDFSWWLINSAYVNICRSVMERDFVVDHWDHMSVILEILQICGKSE